VGERLGLRRAEWLPIVAIALAVAIPTAFSPVLALGAAALALVLVGVVFNAGALLALLVAAFAWDDMLGFPTETVSVVKILGALLLIGYVMRALARDEDVRLPPTLPALLVFTMLVLLSLMISGDVESGLNKTLRYLLFAAFSFLVVQLVRTRGKIAMLLRVFVLSATGAALYGTASWAAGAVDRVSGPIADANDFGYLLASVIPFAVFLAVRDKRARPVWVGCGAILVLALFGTLSRSALVGTAGLVLWAVATRRTRLGGVVAGTVVVVGVLTLAFTLWRPLIDERIESKSRIAAANVESRKAFWGAAAAMAADHPVLGVGPGRFGIEGRRYIRNDPLNLQAPVAHNAYLEVLAEGGIPTLLAFLAFVAGSWSLAARGRRRFLAADDREGIQLATAVQASLVVAIVAACFLSVQITAPIWLLGGLAAVLGLPPPRR
jgi:O-antigen ligase